MHGLTPDGLDIIEEILDIMTMFVYHSEERVHPQLWKLYPQLLHIVCGKPGEVDGGFAFEFLSIAVQAIQNFIAKDNATFQQVCPDIMESFGGQQITYMQMTQMFCDRTFQLNANSSDGSTDGILAMKVILALLENMNCQNNMEWIMGKLLGELHLANGAKHPPKEYI
jgi:hypothetical protein